MNTRKLAVICAALVVMVLAAACGGSKAADGEIAIKGVTIAQGLDANYQAINPTTQFRPNDTIYVSVVVAGRPKAGAINGKFYYGDQLISEATLDLASVNQGVIASVGEDTFAGFNLAPSQSWPVDTIYRFELFVNGKKIGEYPYQVIQ